MSVPSSFPSLALEFSQLPEACQQRAMQAGGVFRVYALDVVTQQSRGAAQWALTTAHLVRIVNGLVQRGLQPHVDYLPLTHDA